MCLTRKGTQPDPQNPEPPRVEILTGQCGNNMVPKGKPAQKKQGARGRPVVSLPDDRPVPLILWLRNLFVWDFAKGFLNHHFQVFDRLWPDHCKSHLVC